MKKQLLLIAFLGLGISGNAQNSLYGWGVNSWGALGNGQTIGVTFSPTQIGTASWKCVDGGLGFSVGIQSDGTLWSWGKNNDNELGDGSKTDNTTPHKIGTPTDWKAISTGVSHTIAIKNDHTIWGFGEGNSGAFGTGAATNLTTPAQIGSGTADWEAVACGNYFTLAIKTNGTLWAWGNNTYGQLGNNSTQDTYSPEQIGADTDWKMVAASQKYNSFAIKTDGTLWAWGFNSFGGAIVKVPTQVGTDNNWKFVATKDDSHFAIKTDGTLWAWGDNTAGQLGIGSNTSVTTMTRVGTDTDWETVAAGDYMAVMMKSNHTIWGTGQAGYNGLTEGTNVPLQIGTDNSWAALGLGSTHAFALQSATSGINEAAKGNSVSVYPNPAIQTLHIKTVLPTVSISLSNAVGQTVYSGNDAEINITGFSNGIYYYLVSLKNGQRISGKFLKQ